MKHVPFFLLLIGVIVGLTVQLPEPVFAAPVHAGAAKHDMASTPDCKARMPKNASSELCKCGKAGCIAMTTSGVAMLLPDSSSFAGKSAASKLAQPVSLSTKLRGRSTVPEPEPPSFRA